MKAPHFLSGALFGVGLCFLVRGEWMVGLAFALIAFIAMDWARDSRE